MLRKVLYSVSLVMGLDISGGKDPPGRAVYGFQIALTIQSVMIEPTIHPLRTSSSGHPFYVTI